MRLAELVEATLRTSRTRARLEKAEALGELLAAAPGHEREVVLEWLCGRLPQGRIGIGPAVLRDLGEVPAAAVGELGVLDVDAVLERVAGTTGTGSRRRRLELLHGLLVRCTADEQDFLRRLLQGELRQGALEGVVLEALARGARVSAEALRRATMLGGDLALVGRAAFEGGEDALGAFRLEPLRPVRPMLADSAPDARQALARLGRAAVEAKLDGARIQVHRQGPEVRVYTRSLQEVTARVPELVELALALPEPRFVLDGEVLALSPEGRPLPFQTTMRRFGRRHDVERLRDELPLVPCFFDLLLLGGQELVDHPLRERSAVLAELVGERAVVPRIETADPLEAEAFLARILERGHEGVLLKDPEAPYEAGRRGSRWIKVKPAHTLDLVVVGVEWGSGRRTGKLSNLHLAARDPAGGGFAMVSKTFKGLSDEVLAWQTERLQGLAVETLPGGLRVRPELVVEVAFDGVLESTTYPGGVALRFARLVRYREDKAAAEADTIETVRALLRG